MSKETNYWQEAKRRRLSRRAFLRTGALAGLSLAAGGYSVGCGSQSTPGSTPTAGTASTKAVPTTGSAATTVPTAVPAAVQPQSGGVLNGFFSTDIPDFSVISNSTQVVLKAVAPIYNNLVMYDPLAPDKIINDLAEKVDVSADGKVYTFTLIKGVKFHDGKPCTSADVKYTFDTVINPPKGLVSRRQGTLSMIDGIEAPDDYTVRFVLKRPAPSLLPMLAQGWMGIMPKHIMQEKGDMKKEAVGTGPFMFKEYVPGVSMEVVRNPNYHVKGRPYVDGIKSYIVPDPATVFSYFRTGKLDFIISMTADEAATAEKEIGDKIEIQKGSYFTLTTLNCNSTRKPWDDIRLRKAVSLAMDRAEAIKVVGQGNGDVAGTMPPFGPWALPAAELAKIPGFGKDIAANRAEAKKLLAEAGYPNGLSATLLVRQRPDYQSASVFAKDQLAKIGIDCKLDVQETAAANDMLNKRNYDITAWLHGINVDDPDSVFGEFYTCKAGYNYSGVCDNELDDLYATQSSTVNAEERKKLVQQLHIKALLLFSKTPLYHHWQFVGFSRRVRNYKIHASPYANFRTQDVWIAKA